MQICIFWMGFKLFCMIKQHLEFEIELHLAFNETKERETDLNYLRTLTHMNKEDEEEVVAFVNFSHVHYFYQYIERNYATHISNTNEQFSRHRMYVHVWRCNCKRIKT